jgi:hypothetical protein
MRALKIRLLFAVARILRLPVKLREMQHGCSPPHM